MKLHSFFNEYCSLSLLKEATTTFCGHRFCKNCIEARLNDKGTCPTCNKMLTLSQLNPAESLQGIVGQFMQMKDEFERANGVDLSTIEITNLSQENSSDVKGNYSATFYLDLTLKS